jgi:hypothetical protein
LALVVGFAARGGIAGIVVVGLVIGFVRGLVVVVGVILLLGVCFVFLSVREVIPT